MVPTYYNSCYRHGVDEKRRLQVPAKWRPAAAGHPAHAHPVAEVGGGAVSAGLPPEEMADLMASIDAMPNDDPKKTVLKRFIGSESMQVALDKAGRICLPDAMARQAGIQGEAVLVGLLDRFEIWNPDRYDKVKAADAVMAAEAFKLME